MSHVMVSVLNCISEAFKKFYTDWRLSFPEFQIKKLDPASKRVSTVAGTGKAGFKDGTALTAQVGLGG